MKRITIKALGVILALAMLLTAVPATAFAKEVRNPYETTYFGTDADSITGKHTVQDNGGVLMEEDGATIKFENVDFYKTTTHFSINYAVSGFFAPRKIQVRLDDPKKGTVIGTYQLDITGTLTVFKTVTFELTTDIKGIHDLYFIDLEGSNAVIRYFKFSGRWEESEGKQSAYPTEIEILNALGIADYSYAKAGTLNNSITRRDFSKMVANLFKVKDIANLSFYDVPATDPDVKAMAAMHALGVVKANSGYFNPEGTITLEDAYKAILSIMGFEMKTNTTYRGRWSLMANDVGISDGVKGNLSSPLTYYDAIQICENTLYVSFPEVLYPNLDMAFPQSESRTVLYSIHKTLKSQGIVQATPSTYISTHEETAPLNQVRIGDRHYNFSDKRIYEFLGYDVVYYYKDVDGIPTVMTAYPSSKNKVTVVDADEITGYNNRTLSYKEGKTTKKLSFTNTTKVLYNGISCQDYTDEDFDLEVGSITFIDNNSTGGYDVISIISGKSYVVESADSAFGIISLKNETPLAISVNPEKVVNFNISIEGTENARITDIDYGDVITVYSSKEYNGVVQNLHIDVSTEVSAQTITEVLHKDGKKYVTVATGTKYELTKNCKSDVEVAPGFVYTFYVSVAGKVVYLERGANRDYKYGFALNVARDSSAFNSQFRIKLVTEAGKIQVLNCADKLMFDGTLVVGALNQSLHQQSAQTLYVTMANGDLRLVPQLIRYKTNNAGEIIYVDTVAVGVNEDEEDLKSVVPYGTAVASNYYVYRAPVDNDKTVVFTVPLVYPTSAADKTAFNQSLVKQYDNSEDTGFSAALLFKTAVSNKCEGFDGDTLNPLKAVVKYGGKTYTSVPSSANWFYILDIYSGLDKDGEPTKIFKVITKGTTTELALTQTMYTKYGANNKLKVGDLCIYAIDNYNEISAIAPLWSKDQSLSISDTYNIRERILSKGSHYWYVDGITGKNGTFYTFPTAKYNDKKPSNEINVASNNAGLNFSGANIICYNAATGEIKKLATNEVTTDEQLEKTNPELKQYAFILMKSNAVKQVIIIREPKVD